MKLGKLKIWIRPVALVTVALFLSACSTDIVEEGRDLELSDVPAQVEAIDVSATNTRAMAMDLNSFGVSVYNVKTGALLADKLLYTKEGTGFTSAGSWRMAKTGDMSAIGISPNMTDHVENITLDADNHYFDYTVPTTEQSMVKIGGDLSFTNKETKGKLTMKFVNSLALFTVKARNELKVEDQDGAEFSVDINVKKIVLHNIASKGRFTYTSDYNGTWTAIDDQYADYAQEFETQVNISSSTFTQVVDSAFVLLPQSPQDRAWAPAAQDDYTEEYALANGIAKANTDHKVYIELQCNMTVVRDNQTIYLWGGEDTYTPIYFPYIKKYCPKSWNTINRQGVYNLKILKGEALDADGRPIKPQAQQNGEAFENAVFINVAPTDGDDNDWVDDWEDWSNEGNTIDYTF